ncbi:hypothetical protein [Aquibacillus albus]|uniref:Uncharacterized protein n=1 Tax=Aquibacillus albus TaxID=1168171 RepID=A0ABS2MVK1_9BACI|nr:hypothetical protein [Aquibacillus albus]MBM7569813.1 hypothetical protein [Aquibacillus albus]
MDGLYFYWISWMLWVVITFLLNKNRKRTFLAVWILTLIIVSSLSFSIKGLQINCAVIVLIIGAIIIVAHSSNWFMNTIQSLCLLFGYVGLLFWEQLSPVWIVLPRIILIPALALFLLFILAPSFKERYAIWCLGVTTGEILHGLILHSYGFTPYVGGFAFLDLLFIEFGLLLLVQGFLEMRKKMEQFILLIEKQKKRWTHE